MQVRRIRRPWRVVTLRPFLLVSITTGKSCAVVPPKTVPAAAALARAGPHGAGLRGERNHREHDRRDTARGNDPTQPGTAIGQSHGDHLPSGFCGRAQACRLSASLFQLLQALATGAAGGDAGMGHGRRPAHSRMDTGSAIRNDAMARDGILRRAIRLMSHGPAEWDVQETLIARLRREAEVRDEELAKLRERLDAAEHELEDLRAIRDALTPPELPRRPGLELAAAFLPAEAERVSGDFYLVAEGPQDSTLLVIGDVVGHGLQAGRRAAFVRTTFAATAPFSDDPRRLLSWANTALVERAGISTEFVTAACVTFHPSERVLRWAYAGHPPALWMHDGQELAAPKQGPPLGLEEDPDYTEGSLRLEAPRACCSSPTD